MVANRSTVRIIACVQKVAKTFLIRKQGFAARVSCYNSSRNYLLVKGIKTDYVKFGELVFVQEYDRRN
jgi:hypothetical protein